MALRKRTIEKSGDNSKKKNSFSKPKRAVRATNLKNNDNDSFRADKKSSTRSFDNDKRKSFASPKNKDSKPTNRYQREDTREERFSSDRKSGERTPFKKATGFNRKPKDVKVYSSASGKKSSGNFRNNIDERSERSTPIKRFTKRDSDGPSEFKREYVSKDRNRTDDRPERSTPVKRFTKRDSDGPSEFKREYVSKDRNRIDDRPERSTPIKRFTKRDTERPSEFKREYVSKDRNKTEDRSERNTPAKRFTKRDSDTRSSNFKKDSTTKPFNRKGTDDKENRNPSFRSPRSSDKPSTEFKKEQKDYKSDLVLTEKKKFSKSKTFKKVANLKPEKHSDLVRLNRYVSNAGICSRREADKLISTGLVSVNGTVVTEMGYQVKNSDDVRFNGQRLSREKRVYIVMNKPKDAITTLDDPDGRNTIMDVLGNEISERIYPIGRLDRNTTGVLLLTNDGELAQRLMHPKYEVEKVYKATLNKVFTGEDFWALTNGVELEDGFIKPDELAYPDPKNKQEVGVLIHSGRNRIIHRMFEHLGYTLDRLDRVSYGGFSKTGLKRGEWRHLSDKEVTTLKRMAKLG